MALDARNGAGTGRISHSRFQNAKIDAMKQGEAVRELRKALKLSQQAFSNLLGLSISSIAHYEGGQRSPDYPVILNLYRAARKAGRQDLAEVFVPLRERKKIMEALFEFEARNGKGKT